MHSANQFAISKTAYCAVYVAREKCDVEFDVVASIATDNTDSV